MEKAICTTDIKVSVVSLHHIVMSNYSINGSYTTALESVKLKIYAIFRSRVNLSWLMHCRHHFVSNHARFITITIDVEVNVEFDFIM